MGFIGKFSATLWFLISLGELVVYPNLVNGASFALMTVWWVLYMFKGQFTDSTMGQLYTVVNAAVWIVSLLTL